jgi:Ca2+-binding EF-hand superfamily protein
MRRHSAYIEIHHLTASAYMPHCMHTQGKIKTGDIAEAEKRFKQLDKDGSGFLTLEDMKNMQWC